MKTPNALQRIDTNQHIRSTLNTKKIAKNFSSFAVVALALTVGHAMGQQSEDDSVSVASQSSKVAVNIEDLRDSSRKTFELIDSNQSGSITLEEVTYWSSEMEQVRMNAEEIDKWWRQQDEISNKFMRTDRETEEFEIVDANSDAVVSDQEFDMREDSIRNHGLKLGFQALDTDDNGGVELVEFNAFIDEIEQADENKDGLISISEAMYVGNRSLAQEIFKLSPSLRREAQTLIAKLNTTSKIPKRDEEASPTGVNISDLRERLTKVFERIDENHSGSITQNEIDLSLTDGELAQMEPQELRHWDRRRREILREFSQKDLELETTEFAIVDKDGDGVLNIKEYDTHEEAIENYRVKLGWKELDTDGSSGVELAEFISFLDDVEKLDENNDGTVSMFEARMSLDRKLIREFGLGEITYTYTIIDTSAQRIQAAKDRINNRVETKE